MSQTALHLRYPTSYCAHTWSHNKSLNVHFWHAQFGVKDHVGVTGVKKVIFTKNVIFPSYYMVWSWDYAHSSVRYHLQKLWVLKFTRGHLGSQGSKGHFHQKCYFIFGLHGVVMWLMIIHQLDLLYTSYGLKIHPGSFGVTGVRSFSPKMLFLLYSLHGIIIRLKHIH